MKVMIVVTHLLGTGHLTRAAALARAFHDAGHTAQIVSGGMPVAHLNNDPIELIQLPALRSNGVDFTKLLQAGDTPATEVTLQQRRDLLISNLEHFQPDALITELFPFGRRILRDEFLALLHAAGQTSKPPAIFASIRDILAPPSKPAKAEFADATVAEFYAAVLVHSDPQVTPLDLSWPVTDALRHKLEYTGFVSPPPAPRHPSHDGSGEVLVTAGGGHVGDALFDCARQAASRTPDLRWRILVGGHKAQPRISTLSENAPPNLIVEAARPDFRQMLHHATASVSMCGYNTALDLLQTQCPAVLIPFDDGSEVEQTIRATALAQQSGFEMIRSADLDPDRLIYTVMKSIKDARSPQGTDGFDGAARTVDIVRGIVENDGGH